VRTSHLITAVFVLILPTVTVADSDKDALAIVDKAIAAQGGAEKLAKAKGETWKAKGVMSAGGMSMAYNADYSFAGPDKFRFDLHMEFGGMKIELAVATDGKVAWEKSGPQLQAMTKEKQAEFEHNVYVMNLSNLLPLKDKAYTLTSLGESKIGEQTVVGIKVARDGKREVNMHFDKSTGLLAKTSSKVNDEFAKKEMVQETLMTGWRDKDGVKVFDKLTILRDGKTYIVEEMSEQKPLEKVDEKLFAKPEK
jgi:outer membrane lipoprotein-sorting protein